MHKDVRRNQIDTIDSSSDNNSSVCIFLSYLPSPVGNYIVRYCAQIVITLDLRLKSVIKTVIKTVVKIVINCNNDNQMSSPSGLTGDIYPWQMTPS